MSIVVSVRLDDKTYNNLVEQAKNLDLTLSDLIRKKLTKNKNIVIKNDNKKLYELNRLNLQISKIGNNINQIAKYVNTQKIIDKIVAKALLEIANDLELFKKRSKKW